MSGKHGKIASTFVKVGIGIIVAINLFFILSGAWELLLVTPIAFVLTSPLWKATAKDYVFLLWWNQK